MGNSNMSAGLLLQEDTSLIAAYDYSDECIG